MTRDHHVLSRLKEEAKAIGNQLILNPKIEPPRSLDEAKYQQEIIALIQYKLGFTSEAAQTAQQAFEYLHPKLHELITEKIRMLFNKPTLSSIEDSVIKSFHLEGDDIAHIYSRMKSTCSIWNKIRSTQLLESMTLDQFTNLVDDFIAIRWNMIIKPGENRLDAQLNGLKYAPRQSITRFRNQNVKQESGFSCEPLIKLYYVVNNLPIELQVLGGRLEEYMCAKGYADYKTGIAFSALQLTPEQSAARLGLCIYYSEHGMLDEYRKLMLQELTQESAVDYPTKYIFTLDEKPNNPENQRLRFTDSEQPVYCLAKHIFSDQTLNFRFD